LFYTPIIKCGVPFNGPKKASWKEIFIAKKKKKEVVFF